MCIGLRYIVGNKTTRGRCCVYDIFQEVTIFYAQTGKKREHEGASSAWGSVPGVSLLDFAALEVNSLFSVWRVCVRKTTLKEENHSKRPVCDTSEKYIYITLIIWDQ